MWKQIPFPILAFAGVLAETSFPSGILVPLTVFFSISEPVSRGLIIAVAGGVISDAFLPGPFGSRLLALLGVFAVTRFLVHRWLTGQSFYAILGLAVAGTVVAETIIHLYAAIASVTNPRAAIGFSISAFGARLLIHAGELIGMMLIAAAVRAPLARIFMPRRSI